MTTKPISRPWWYRLLVGLLAAFSWCVAVAAFTGRLSALRSEGGQSDLLTVAGWGLGLCAFVLLAEFLSPARPSDLRGLPKARG